MKRFFLSVLAVAGAVCLAGCGGNAEAAYVDMVTDLTGETYSDTQTESLLDLGHSVCDMLDEGTSVAGVVVVLALAAEGDEQIELAAAVVQSAPRTLCTEHEPELDTYIESL